MAGNPPPATVASTEGSRVAQRTRVRWAAGPYLLIAPKLLAFAAFMVIPIAWSIAMAFQSGSILKGLDFVGFRNLEQLVRDKLFWTSLRNSLLYSVIVIPAALGLGLVLAGLLNRPIRFRWAFRLALIVPTVTSTVAAAVIWGYLLQGDSGLFNRILEALGMEPVLWLGSRDWIMPIIALVEIWRGTGFYALVFLAGMQSIPRHLYDAGALDGVTGISAFRRITLPLLRPVILFTTVIATIWNIQIFDSPYVMTNGGPGHSSTTMAMYIYNQAFSLDNMGFAAAMACVLMLLIFVLAAVQLTLFRKDIQF